MKHEMRTKRNDLLSGKVIKGLASRNMTGYYAKTGEEALRIALSAAVCPPPRSGWMTPCRQVIIPSWTGTRPKIKERRP